VVEGTPVTGDLNQVIASAVQARIETDVAAALSGSDLMGQYVAAALHQEITVEKNYRSRKTTYLREAIDGAIREATKDAIKKVVAEEAEAIEAAVATELRRNVKGMASTLVGSVMKAVDNPYGIKVTLSYPDGDR
jgi:hypothetical protein